LLKYKGIHADVVASSMIKVAKQVLMGFKIYESGEMQRMKKFRISDFE
jgi:hypothetical protein